MSRTDAHTPFEVMEARALRKYQPNPQLAYRWRSGEVTLVEESGDLPNHWWFGEASKVFSRYCGEGEWRAEMANHRDRRTAETVSEAIKDMLAVDHKDTVETGLGTLVHDVWGHGWWFTPRKRTSPELENVQIISELHREHLLGRPGTPIVWTTGHFTKPAPSLEEEANERAVAQAKAKAEAKAKKRANAILMARLEDSEPAKPKEPSYRSMMTEIPSARGGMRMRRAHVVS